MSEIRKQISTNTHLCRLEDVTQTDKSIHKWFQQTFSLSVAKKIVIQSFEDVTNFDKWGKQNANSLFLNGDCINNVVNTNSNICLWLSNYWLLTICKTHFTLYRCIPDNILTIKTCPPFFQTGSFKQINYYSLGTG